MTRRFARGLGGARIHEGTPEGNWRIVTVRGRAAAVPAALLTRPDPIEKAWSKFKQLLRSAKARTEQALEQAITEAIQEISADNAQAWFRLTLDWVQL
jgi:hypothetical protein